jgi:hypothetical protein
VKNLDEKRLLARMARNVGQPDLALEESIRREENLTENLFTKLPKTDEKPMAAPVLEEKNLFTPPATLIDRAVEAIHAAPSKPPVIAEQMRDAELRGIRSQITDLMAKVGTLSWGGGGTGAVRFAALDDHQHPTDIRVLEFNTAGPAYPPPVGSMSWNPNEECVDITQPDGTTLQVGLEQYIRVHNDTGTTLESGELVMFSGVEEPYPGVIEHVPMVDRFIANAAFPPIYVVGVMTEAVANAENGRATTFGKVRNIDTTGTPVSETWVIGDLLFASATSPGKLTKVRPSAPNIVVSVAVVLHVDATNGEILVRPSIFPQLHTGTFYSTAPQSASLANTAYPVAWNSDGLKCPHVNRANTSEIVVSEQGLYSFEFRLHLEAPKNQTGRVWVWARVAGVDVPNSTTELSLFGSGSVEGRYYPSWAFVQHMGAGENFQLMWATDNTTITIYAPAATAFAPAAMPSAIRVTQVNL